MINFKEERKHLPKEVVEFMEEVGLLSFKELNKYNSEIMLASIQHKSLEHMDCIVQDTLWTSMDNITRMNNIVNVARAHLLEIGGLISDICATTVHQQNFQYLYNICHNELQRKHWCALLNYLFDGYADNDTFNNLVVTTNRESKYETYTLSGTGADGEPIELTVDMPVDYDQLIKNEIAFKKCRAVDVPLSVDSLQSALCDIKTYTVKYGITPEMTAAESHITALLSDNLMSHWTETGTIMELDFDPDKEIKKYIPTVLKTVSHTYTSLSVKIRELIDDNLELTPNGFKSLQEGMYEVFNILNDNNSDINRSRLIRALIYRDEYKVQISDPSFYGDLNVKDKDIKGFLCNCTNPDGTTWTINVFKP